MKPTCGIQNKIKMKKLSLLLWIIFTAIRIFADRGVIYLHKDIDLEEPAQRAIIAHNGTWELLILQTDVMSSHKTKTLEFMPLPSLPKVTLAPKDCFSNLQEILTRHEIKYIIIDQSAGIGGPNGKTEGIKIVANYDLGPHSITIVEIKNTKNFHSWVTDFVKQNALGKAHLPEKLDQIVADYCKRGFRFMAFDVLTLPGGMKTIAPVTYKFKCDHVYYPLKVTNLYGGQGTVELFFAINPWLDPNADGPSTIDFYSTNLKKSKEKQWVSSNEVKLKRDDLKSIHPEIGALFGYAGANFFSTKYEGNLQFDSDIWLHLGYSSPYYLVNRFLFLLQLGHFESLEFLISAPFALNGEKVYKTKVEAIKGLKKFIKKHDLSKFITWESGSGGPIKNKLELSFVENNLKDKNWERTTISSKNQTLSFFVINQNTMGKGLNNYKIVDFAIESDNKNSN